ncbi:FadR/GntR family transcriptional regulator [Rhizobium sp. L1K21]|uniref:FadR/GntR family transcriptional regulator n=1 Tax=Rhizobium sp. L1K21 TaxID=2954933 RepID=UPI0020933E02|nr:FadR/GntR family transcriptional regulator [Rhizobium sp. L1K21]MCO6184684.1 FadR family transcriptional regulator [Rhizobium sp. L1K21]
MFTRSALAAMGNSSANSSVVNMIGQAIVGGVYEPGSLLPGEVEMRERYSVSRTALREAYSKLTAKGLLTARPKVGTSVRSRMQWNMLDPEVLSWHLQTLPARDIAVDLYALRRMIEPGAAELAAKLHTSEDMQRIDDAHKDMSLNASNEHDLVEADFRFHMAILSATKNPFINAFSALIHAAMISSFEISWRGAEVIKEQRLNQHGAVADAIRSRDSALAKQRMQELLDDSINDVHEALAKA